MNTESGFNKGWPGGGFTLLEILVAIFIGTLLLWGVNLVFFQYFGMAQKGEDYLTSVRDAMVTIEDFRKELKASSEVVSPKPIFSTDAQKIDLSSPSVELRLRGSRGEITYSIATDSSGRMFLEKGFWEAGKRLKKTDFNIDRLKGFEVHWIHQKQRPGESYFTTKFLYVMLELQGAIGTKSGTKVKIGTLITPFFNTAENSNWP